MMRLFFLLIFSCFYATSSSAYMKAAASLSFEIKSPLNFTNSLMKFLCFLAKSSLKLLCELAYIDILNLCHRLFLHLLKSVPQAYASSYH